MSTPHPSYQPGEKVPADGLYFLTGTTNSSSTYTGPQGDVDFKSHADTDVKRWVREFQAGEIFPRLDGRGPNPLWIPFG